MLSNPQFQIASQLLIGLMRQARSRDRGDQIADVRHALEVSAELIRQWQGNHLPTRDYAPPTPAAQARTKEALVDRAFVATDQWRRDRGQKQVPGSSTVRFGPAIH